MKRGWFSLGASRLEATFTHVDYARYPFLPKYEELLRTAPSFASPEFQKILTYARKRIAQAARGMISQPLPEDDWAWALSFYVAGLAIRFAGNPLLLNRFARLEAERSRSHFERELGIQQLLPSMLTIVNHLFKLDVRYEGPDKLSCGLMRYLEALASRPTVPPRMKLSNRLVDRGRVYMNRQELALLVRGRWYSLILSRLGGIQAFGEAPGELQPLIQYAREVGESLAPKARARLAASAKYEYIEELLQKPVVDGRHRLVWLVLTPYLVNVKGLEVEEAVAVTVDYLKRCGWGESRLERFVRYHAQRAKRIGLKPPRLETIQKRDPQLYQLIIGAQPG
jgi:hypothetical protein